MTSDPQLEREFAEAMVRIYDRAKRECALVDESSRERE
jgi:hypothetical protein